jgi:hypothetical protein
MRLFFLFIFFSFELFSQKENQFSTTQKGVFIEQNNLGKFGIVNSKNEILIPIVNDYIKELSDGNGFIVYEKITVNGPDEKEGILRYYDQNFKDVFNRTFTKIRATAEHTFICYNKNLCGLYKETGELIAPLCFSEINPLNNNLYWFDVDASLRENLASVLFTKTISEEEMPSNINIEERDGYNLFQGVFNIKGELICNGQFRIVEIILKNGELSLFAVQNQRDFIENDGASYFAIMNGKGEFVSEYIYTEVLNIDGEIFGEVETETELKRIPLDQKGFPKQ